MKNVVRSPGWRLWAAPALALVLVAGCGEQDLYKPPTAPYQIVGRLALPSEVEDVAVLGETAYLAGGQAGLHIVDISDPANPVLLRTLDTVKYAESVRAASTPSASGVTDIAFVVEGTEGITTYDVTDPANAFSFNQGTTAVDGIGLFVEVPEDPSEPYLVYLAESWKGLRIFESDPSVPGLLRYNGVFTSTVGYALAVAVKDGYAYVADDEMGLAVVDVRTRILGAVRVVSSCDTPGNASAIAVEGSYAFLADYENGLVTMEIREEGSPAVPVPYLAGSLSLGGRCQAIVVRDNKAFIAAGDGGVHMADVSHPESPRYLGTAITTEATGVALAKAGIVAVSDRYEGLVLLAGGGSFSDQVPPAQVLDLSAAGVDSTTVRLRWRAPGNDGLSGTATAYDVRFASDTIATAAEWDAASLVEGEISPSPRGTQEVFDVTGLLPATTYWFALKTGDASGNWSRLSNPAFATTPSGNVPPVLSGGRVTPEAGLAGTTFTFEVTYEDGDGDAPSEARVLVGGTPYDMALVSGDYESGALFRVSAELPVGAYDHVFSFRDGHTPVVTTPPAAGPAVGRLLFVMGSPEDEPGRDPDETRHTVVFTRRFWIEDHEVAQGEYEAVMKTNPSRFAGANRPVERVTWLDAILYCNARSVEEGFDPAYSILGTAVTWNKDANGYRLPTEAEWEAACRAGTETAFAGGAITEQGCGIDPVLDVAGWYCGNALGATHDAKGKQPNAWDPPLYDMHGNVWEWCWDFYRADLGSAIAVDPEGSPGGSQRVIRGGSWYYFARDCRSASRAPYWPNSADDIVGFRVARTLFEE